MRARRTRTCAGAAIFVHSGAEGALKMCGRAPHVRTSIFHLFFTIKSIKFSKKKNSESFFRKFFFEKCAGTGARAKAGVRVRAPHTIKMCAMCVRVRPKNRAH